MVICREQAPDVKQEVALIPSLPSGLSVGMVEVPGEGGGVSGAAIEVVSRGVARRGVLIALLGGAIGVLVSSPGVLTAGIVAASAYNLAVLYRRWQPLLVHEGHVTFLGKTIAIADVTDVTWSITRVWLWRGTTRDLVFLGRPTHVRWIARMLREMVRLGHRPIVLALPIGYAGSMTALKAHVVNGRIVVDEPVDLPDGAELRVYLYDVASDSISAEDRVALEQALDRSIEQADRGELIDADEVLADLRRR